MYDFQLNSRFVSRWKMLIEFIALLKSLLKKEDVNQIFIVPLKGNKKRSECGIYVFIPQNLAKSSVSFSTLPIPWTSGGTDMHPMTFFTLLEFDHLFQQCYFESQLF